MYTTLTYHDRRLKKKILGGIRWSFSATPPSDPYIGRRRGLLNSIHADFQTYVYEAHQKHPTASSLRLAKTQVEAQSKTLKTFHKQWGANPISLTPAHPNIEGFSPPYTPAQSSSYVANYNYFSNDIFMQIQCLM